MRPAPRSSSLPVFVDRSQKPGDVEPAGDVRQSGPAGHQDQPAVPDRGQLVPRHQGRPGASGDWTRTLSSRGLGDQQEAAVAQRRDGRQGRSDKPRPVGSTGARLEPEILGAPEHLRCADLVGPSRCRICPASAATPWRCSSVTRASRPGSARSRGLVSVLIGVLQGDVASGVRLRQQRLLVRRLIRHRHRRHGPRPP